MPRDAHTHRIAESQELRSGRRDRNPVVPFPLERNTSLQDLHLLTEGEFRANSIDTRMKEPLAWQPTDAVGCGITAEAGNGVDNFPFATSSHRIQPCKESQVKRHR